ncbi:MAG TPA: hypothetical protein VLB84_08805 [Bacteroidia bacterium]|nr:hypothetical protein [Bacteroidia bacterium]
MNTNFCSAWLVLFFLYSCVRHPAGQTSHIQGCYSTNNKKDSIKMQLSSNGNYIKGYLTYSLYQKDKNNGTFEGEMHHDTLIADYTFNSEGNTSVREIAFLLKDTLLIEGYGEMKYKGEKLVFKNTKYLSFPGTIVLRKTSCQPSR